MDKAHETPLAVVAVSPTAVEVRVGDYGTERIQFASNLDLLSPMGRTDREDSSNWPQILRDAAKEEMRRSGEASRKRGTTNEDLAHELRQERVLRSRILAKARAALK